MFNKDKLAKLLIKAKGENRSINEYGNQSGTSPAHISRLTRGLLESPPNPQTLKKLADHAYNYVTYDDLMKAAGHMSRESPAAYTADPSPDSEGSNPVNELNATMRDLGQEITRQFHDLKGMTDDEKENLKIFLEGLKARRRKKEKPQRKRQGEAGDRHQ